jgi:AraC-like DNA-binding protein
VRAARNVADFVAAPFGQYTRGRQFAVWCRDARLAGSVHWGRTDEEDARRLLDALEFVRALRSPIDMVADASRASIPDEIAFRLIGAHITARGKELARQVRRVAVVHPPGLAGASAAGFMTLVQPPFGWRLFTEPSEAFGWLGAESPIRPLESSLFGAPTTLALRERLGRGPATLAQAARAVGSSPRTLQRTLLAEGTSFRAEIARARVSAAIPLVLDSSMKLGAIARQVGYSSTATFSRLYRRIAGESPSRARARRSPVKQPSK